MLIIGLISFLLSLFFPSCTQSCKVEGTVQDVAEYTLTVKTKGLGVVTFMTREARMRCPAGIHRGSPVVVTISGDIVDGFSVADRVVAPEAYNLLIGRWMAPCEDNSDMMHGFELLEDGEVVAIGEHSIPCHCWHLNGDTLSMAECESNLDADQSDLAHHWHIEHLGEETLTISCCGKTKSFARTSRK